MSEPAKKQPTYEDLLAIPEGTRAEIINGHIETSAAKRNFGHRYVTSAMAQSINSRFGGGDSEWIIEIEPDVQFGPNVLSPDLAGWKKARRGKINPLESLVTVIPDWVCEILSPSSGRRDRVEKFKIYQETGVGYYWIVDPINQTIEAFANDATQAAWKRIGVWGGDEKARIEPFQDMEIALARFWVSST
ncbi:Uma2 family endonuclease [Bdellovibrionota bacterium FG-2]